MPSSRRSEQTLHAGRVPLLVSVIPLVLVSTSAQAMLKCRGNDNSVSYASEFIAGASCSTVDSAFSHPAPQAALSARDRTSIALSKSALTNGAQPDFPRRSPYTPPAHFYNDAGSGTRKESLQSIVRATMYSYIDNGIRYYFSSKPVRLPSHASLILLHFSSTCFLCSRTRDVNITALVLNTRSYRHEIEDAALNFGVDEALVRAVIHAESNFEPNAISGLGAQGLMQLMPATARRFGVKDAFDAAQNIRGGVQYLAWLLKHFNGDLDRALAGYNAGENAVGRYNDVPPYPETQSYVSRVKLLADRYRSTP
ncbi:lytic transglycosylase domain-containing protein [Paraburkholderia jirisanensis]